MVSPLFHRFCCAAAASLLLGGGLATEMHGSLRQEQLAQLPEPAKGTVDFARDIQPIFESSCVQCHARGKSKGVFSMETREDFLLGGDTGPPAEAGKSAESLLVDLISGLDPETVMPKKGKKLTPEQVAVVRAWIDQGMAWPETITFFKHEPANLRSRELADLQVPKNFPNPIDALVDAGFARHHVEWPKLVDDRTYARRVWLDTIGLLPPTEELAAFIADSAPDKRARLVERLLGDRQGYAEHWLTFWNDLLRNDYKGTGYIDGGRKPITDWLYNALARNLPYDRFVAALIDPGAEEEGFANGIVWRGAVNASMVPPMQAAQGVAQVFLGVNLKCASCHDSFINEYTLEDSYGLASVYADGPLEIAECDKLTGHMGRVKFLYEEIGGIEADADRAARKRQLADIITGRKNGRLPRTMVNRLWQRFMGHGLVEPVDEMDKPAWSPELMDWLAEDLAAHGYDLKHTMAQIFTSRAYQLPAVNIGENEPDYVFRGPGVRRLDAEQFADAIMTLTGIGYPSSDAKVNRGVALQGGEPGALPLQPKWIWATPGAEVKARPAVALFKRTISLASAPTEAVLTIAADNSYDVSINGKKVASSSKRTSTGANSVDLTSALQVGENVISIKAVNFLSDGTDQTSLRDLNEHAQPAPGGDDPAGLILYARVRAGEVVMDFVSDRSWLVSVEGEQDRTACELGDVDLAPWKLGSHFLELAAANKDTLPVRRASLVAADPLMVALGRPNREQIVTVRQGLATTLQGLELTNGGTLAALLKRGADEMLADAPPNANTDTLVASLYRHALGRAPLPAEQSAAAALVGTPAKTEGVQDLLWAVAMLPEFQLIH